jgi:hypothetical protein
MLTAVDGGEVLAVDGAERVRGMPEVQQLYLFADKGSIVHVYEQAGHKLGYVVLRAGSAAGLRRAEQVVHETLAFRLAPSEDDLAVGWP